MDRTKILKGPAKIEYDGETFFSRSDVAVTFSSALFDKTTAAYGRHGQGVEDKRVTVAFTPVTYTADQAALLCPYATTAIGAGIYGATDTPLIITPINGQPLTVANAAVTSPPGMTYSAIQPLWSGDVTFTGLVANDADPNEAASYYSWGAEDSGVNIGENWDQTKDIYLPYTAQYKGSDLEAKEGFSIAFEINLSDYKPDNLGTVDMHLQSHTANVTWQPAGNTEEEIENLFSNFSLAIGAGATPGDIVIAGPDEGDLRFTLKNATPGPERAQVYGPETDRLGEITLQAQRSVSSGSTDALYEFGEVPA